MPPNAVIIVGAGVAGLTLAILLAEQGIESHVLESRQHFDGPTSGVRISNKGAEILRLMQLDAIGEDTGRVEMRFGGLSAGFTTPVSNASAIIVTRLALHEQLMKRASCLGIRVRVGIRVATVIESADCVEVTSESNETLTGAVLVGADGVGSTIRRVLNPGQGSMKAYAGYLGVGLIATDESKVEMTMHHYPGQWVGVASCGRVSSASTKKSLFMWTHFRMSEADAKRATQESVRTELARRAERWRPELKSKYDLWTGDADAILAHGPVYNGKPAVRWYSDRTMLIGDAAHPYGPGGQGISMALNDAKELCAVIARGFTEEDKREFQRSRGEESRRLGEAAEKRNAKAPPSTSWGVFAEGVATKAMELFTRGKLEL